MRPRHSLVGAVLLLAAGCGPGATRVSLVERPDDDPTRAVAHLLDAWHAAAAHGDAERYFALMTERAVFLGTDATERWHRDAFRRYAAPHFEDGEGWTFRATRRAIVLHESHRVAWFDEDLATGRLGPARGSGVAVRDEAGRWRIAHYNLALTVPNGRFPAVRDALRDGTGDDGEGAAAP